MVMQLPEGDRLSMQITRARVGTEKIGKEVWYWLDKEFLVTALGSVRDYLREKA